jgi:hypothetical protein
MKKHMLNTEDPNPDNWVDMCNYKNCQNPVKAKGWYLCDKHIGQQERDFQVNHIRIGNLIFKTDKATALIFNKGVK